MRIWFGESCEEWALSPVEGWDEYCPVMELTAERARSAMLMLIDEGQNELLFAYRTGTQPKESTFNKILKARKFLSGESPAKHSGEGG